MKKVHFIAIGGSAMHNLAIALKRNGEVVTGSDDEIFEPSRLRLLKEQILPEAMGWYPSRITPDLDAVILGMHAREDNPELLRAKKLNLPIFSYPEFLYEQSKHKTRIVIGGSHGKTTITSMILHAAQLANKDIDYMVGAQLDGYDCMVKFSKTAQFMILEGDEYLSSPIDKRPKFHLYHPNISLISGIAMDHINVFKTFEEYSAQFSVFVDLTSDTLIYNEEDETVRRLGERASSRIKTIPYHTLDYQVFENGTKVRWKGQTYSMSIFGHHNLLNMMGAMKIGELLGIDNDNFLKYMTSFTGAGKRLQKVIEKKDFVMYKDFAHSPSKLRATTSAIREQFPHKRVFACMELHTFSSLNKDFLPLYRGAMDAADFAIVYFNPKVVHHKRLPELKVEEVQNYFGSKVKVETNAQHLLQILEKESWNNTVLLMMSSGNFDGIDYDLLGAQIAANL